LDFVLAINEINSSQALHYIFRLLDIDGQGFLDEFTFSFFLRGMAAHVPCPLNIPVIVVSFLLSFKAFLQRTLVLA
jgi:hypothetical protein